jgi:hypothetical protein
MMNEDFKETKDFNHFMRVIVRKMTERPPKKSVSSDIFKTPAYAVRMLYPYIRKEWKIWECADDNNGRIVQTLRGDGYDVVGTDILSGFDFLSPLMPSPDFDMILTNPPYSIKDEWIARCYELGKPWALLLPIAALGEQDRVRMYKENGIQLLLPPGRINFETPSGEGSGAWQYHAWFCHGLDFPQQINFA